MGGTVAKLGWIGPEERPSALRAAPKVFTWANDRIELTFSSGESVFAIIPLGFALTYCNSPIIVYEKNVTGLNFSIHLVC